MNPVVNHLGLLPRFRNLSRKELDSLSECIDLPKAYDADSVLCVQGSLGDKAFIVITGELVGMMKLPGGREEEMGRYRPGDMVGEISLLERSPRTMTVRASCTSDVLVIDKTRLDVLRERDEPGAYKLIYIITQILCDRLRSNNLRARSRYFGEATISQVAPPETDIDPIDTVKTALKNLKQLLLKNS